MKIPFIVGKNIYLRQLMEEDINERYLSWLNDPEVLEFRTRRVFPSTMNDINILREEMRNNKNLQLAIVTRNSELHIGNIRLGPIDWYHSKAEISILIGEKSVWGQGYGKEAIYLLSKHAFENANMHRVSAASPNPAFNKVVRDLGWIKEGELREAFRYKDKYISIECYSLLAVEFSANCEFGKRFCP